MKLSNIYTLPASLHPVFNYKDLGYVLSYELKVKCLKGTWLTHMLTKVEQTK